VVCGASCCDTTTGTCIDGSCCPTSRACGNVCCAADQECSDPATGTCSMCGTGFTLCTPLNGGVQRCCPTGAECCGTKAVPTECCHSDQICCQQEVPFGECTGTGPADCRPIR
jgi:hypothetical protein